MCRIYWMRKDPFQQIQQTAQKSRFLLSDHSIFRIMRFKNFMTGTVTAIHFALFSSLPEYHDDFL